MMSFIVRGNLAICVSSPTDLKSLLFLQGPAGELICLNMSPLSSLTPTYPESRQIAFVDKPGQPSLLAVNSLGSEMEYFQP